jgi:putative hydrolase of the HAD superfamily
VTQTFGCRFLQADHREARCHIILTKRNEKGPQIIFWLSQLSNLLLLSIPSAFIRMPPPIRAVIFDFDGLIVDTESTGYHTWREIFAEYGHELPVERYAQVVGTDFNTSYDPRRDLEQLTGRDFDWEAVEVERKTREGTLRQHLHLLPGVADLLQEADALGLRIAIASSSPRVWIDSWMDQLGLHDHFHHISTVDDTGKVKPDPSLFLHAAEKLGVQPEEAVIFEDSLNGLRAAMAAGIRCIVAPGPMTRHLDFTGAWQRVETLAQVTLADLMS